MFHFECDNNPTIIIIKLFQLHLHLYINLRRNMQNSIKFDSYLLLIYTLGHCFYWQIVIMSILKLIKLSHLGKIWNSFEQCSHFFLNATKNIHYLTSNNFHVLMCYLIYLIFTVKVIILTNKNLSNPDTNTDPTL